MIYQLFLSSFRIVLKDIRQSSFILSSQVSCNWTWLLWIALIIFIISIIKNQIPRKSIITYLKRARISWKSSGKIRRAKYLFELHQNGVFFSAASCKNTIIGAVLVPSFFVIALNLTPYQSPLDFWNI